MAATRRGCVHATSFPALTSQHHLSVQDNIKRPPVRNTRNQQNDSPTQTHPPNTHTHPSPPLHTHTHTHMTYCGIWVVLPEPVSPTSTISLDLRSISRKSVLYCHTGSFMRPCNMNKKTNKEVSSAQAYPPPTRTHPKRNARRQNEQQGCRGSAWSSAGQSTGSCRPRQAPAWVPPRCLAQMTLVLQNSSSRAVREKEGEGKGREGGKGEREKEKAACVCAVEGVG